MSKQVQAKFKINQYYKKKFAEKKTIGNYIKLTKIDIIHKIIKNLATRVYKILKKLKIKKEFTHMQLIGCSSKKLKRKIEKKFMDGMSFENYGEWEIDHVKPIKRFMKKFKEKDNLDVSKELLKCFGYKNLQPLWKLDNKKKGAKYISDSD